MDIEITMDDFMATPKPNKLILCVPRSLTLLSGFFFFSFFVYFIIFPPGSIIYKIFFMFLEIHGMIQVNAV